MKKFLTILFFFVSVISFSQSKHIIHPGGDGGIIITNGGIFVPGDTIAICASDTWTYLYFNKLNGTPNNKIVIMSSSEDSIATIQEITIDTSTYVKITGRRKTDTDTSSYLTPSRNFGIRIWNNPNKVGIAVQGKSRCVEAEMCDVYRLNYAVRCKNEVSCDTTMDYFGDWSYRMDSCYFHHIYAHNIGQDVFYLGSTGQLPTDRPITCGGVTQYYMPMALSNTRCEYNLIDSANRTGIQLGGHRYGVGSIRKNIIKNVGYEYNQQQGDGIAIGGMSGGVWVDSNIIRTTFLYGVLDFGAGWTNYITNNDIDSSGYLYINPAINMDSLAAATGMTNLGNHILGNTWSNPQSIITSTKQTVPQRTKTVVVVKNKLGANIGNINVYLVNFGAGYEQNWTKNNIVCNNTKQDGTTPANIVRYTYNAQAWPVYSINCSFKPKTGVIY